MRTSFMSIVAMLLAQGERNERHESRALDGLRELALMRGAGTAAASRDNLGVGRHEALQETRVFVIEVVDRVGAEVAGFGFQWLHRI